MIAVCGIYDCETCELKAEEICLGCANGNIALASAGKDRCKVYDCVISQGISHCNDCLEDSCVLKRNVENICPLRSQFQKKRWWAGQMSRAMERRRKAADSNSEPLASDRVINRLRWYLTALDAFESDGQSSVSSWQLAEKVGVNAALIRKDLSRFGEFGTPSYGYRVEYLRETISGILRLNKPRGIVWVGAKCYKEHTAAVERLARYENNVLALFDSNPQEIGTQCGELSIRSLDDMQAVLADLDISAAVIALPGKNAQAMAEKLVESGVSAILNLSGEMLILPEHVRIVSFDIAGELLELAYYSKS